MAPSLGANCKVWHYRQDLFGAGPSGWCGFGTDYDVPTGVVGTAVPGFDVVPCGFDVVWWGFLVKLEQILHLKVDCSDFDTVRNRGSLPGYCVVGVTRAAISVTVGRL